MNIQGLIERYEKFKASKKKLTSVDLVLKDLRSLDEPEPLPFKLKDVVRRIRGFDPTTQTRWLNDILKELGDDYGSMKYREGYDQGKFEGEWVGNQLKDADKIRQELNKPVIPQFVAEHIEWTKKEDFHLLGAMSRENFDKKLEDWFYTDDNMELFARAWLDGYEVEKEPKYTVKFKATNQYLCDDDGVGLHISPSFRSNFRKSDLEKLSLTEVFDSPLFEVEEVTK
nr:MAG TPA: Protein of unknown function (DUF1642) [Caudoviricetes sp.]